MKLVLGKNYPSEPPRGFFMTKIFHPNVASNGEICVNTLKKDWKADLGIKHVLLVSRENEVWNAFLCEPRALSPLYSNNQGPVVQSIVILRSLLNVNS